MDGIRKSTLPRDVWMVLNECMFCKMVDINKIKELRLGPTYKKKKLLNSTTKNAFEGRPERTPQTSLVESQGKHPFPPAC